jgi:hypothetical protein
MFKIEIGFCPADEQVQAMFRDINAWVHELTDDGDRAGQLFERLLRLSPGVRAAVELERNTHV